MSRYCERMTSKRGGLLLLACAVLFGSGCAPSASAHSGMDTGVNYYAGDFDFLAQYGEWMGVPPYGVVWCPYVDESWAPFYDGRWIWTSDGWAWNSYEPFGDLVYHYGYWYYDDTIGWFWVPGDEWSPARVQWYTYGRYCGWAPLPPPNFYWPDPWVYCDYDIWVIVNIDNFCDEHVGNRAIDQPRYREVLQRNGVVKGAPDIQQVKTLARREIPVTTIARRPMDVSRGQIKIAERSATQRKVAETRATSQTQQKAIASRQNTQAQREVPATRQNPQAPREVTTTRQNAQNTQAQREVPATRQPAQVERKVETSTRSAQSTESRTVERSSDRPVKAR